MTEIKAQNFEDLIELIHEKDQLLSNHSDRFEREDIVRGLYNGLTIMSEDEADDENVGEITNHLIGYKNLIPLETRIYGIYSNTDALLSLKVDTDDPEFDYKAGVDLSKLINKAIYMRGRFGAFWKSVAGEISISGKAPSTYDEDGDWCPQINPKILLPDGTGSSVETLTYAFLPKELDLHFLRKLKRTAKKVNEEAEDLGVDVESSIDIAAVNQVIDVVRSNIKSSGTVTLSENDESQYRKSIDDTESSCISKTTVNAWYYYEVRFDAEAKKKVVDVTLFTEETTLSTGIENQESNPKSNKQEPVVLAEWKGAFDSPSQWLHCIIVDASIGGDARFSTAKGIGEMSYNSDVSVEELFNLKMDGDKIRAMPKVKVKEGGNPDSMLGWDIRRDSVVPDAAEEFNFKNSGNDTSEALAFLMQNSSSITGGSHSNTGRDQEKRVQALGRQANASLVSTVKISDVYKALEVLVQEMVRRFFVGDIDEGATGYDEIAWFRDRANSMGYDLEQLAKTSFGFFDHLTVTISKAAGSGDIDTDQQNAITLMNQIQHYEPAARSRILYRFTLAMTGDSDFADSVVNVSEVVINQQRVVAENEFDTIVRRARLGREIPVGDADVHQIHIPVHLEDMASLIALADTREWTVDELLQFTGMQTHVTEHIQILLSNPATNAEGAQFTQQLQQIVASGDAIASDLNERQAEQDDLTLMERAELELKVAESNRKDRELALKEKEQQDLSDNRKARQAGIDRKGNFDMVTAATKLQQDQQ